MRSYHLLPRYFRPIGFALAIPGFVLGFLFLFFKITIPGFGPPAPDPANMTGRLDNYTNELALALLVIGIVFIAFSKLKSEDELTAQLRLNALHWAILLNYILIACLILAEPLISRLDVWGGALAFLDFNLFVPLVAFVLRFYYLLYKSKNEYHVSKLYFLPNKPFNKLAQLAAVPCIILFLFCVTWGFNTDSYITAAWFKYLQLIYFVLPVVLLIWMYSKEPVEDECISLLRLKAMQITVYINCIILLFGNIYFYQLDFLNFETLELSLFPLIFIVVFRYNLYRLSNSNGNDQRSNGTLNLKAL